MQQIAKKDIYIILPSFNEEKYIAKVIKKLKPIHSNIVVVDDGSSDDTYKIAKQNCKNTLSHTVNLGKGAALKTGCDYAFAFKKAKAVIFMDSDDQHDPNEIKDFIKYFKEGHQVIFGVRSFDEKMPLLRIMMNRIASVIIYFLFGSYIPDIPSGFKAITADAYKKIKWDSNDYSVEMEIAARVARYKIPYKFFTIKTIYHDFQRGMTILDTLNMIQKIIHWRLTL